MSLSIHFLDYLDFVRFSYGDLIHSSDFIWQTLVNSLKYIDSVKRKLVLTVVFALFCIMSSWTFFSHDFEGRHEWWILRCSLSMLILCPIVRDLCIVRWVDISLKSDQDSMSIFFKWNIWFIDESSRFVKLTHEKRSRIELVPCLFTFFSDAVPSKSAIMTSWKRC